MWLAAVVGRCVVGCEHLRCSHPTTQRPTTVCVCGGGGGQIQFLSSPFNHGISSELYSKIQFVPHTKYIPSRLQKSVKAV